MTDRIRLIAAGLLVLVLVTSGHAQQPTPAPAQPDAITVIIENLQRLIADLQKLTPPLPPPVPPPVDPPPPPPSVSTPFTGQALALPGRVELEDFDHGGPNLAYLDTTIGNSGEQYRQTDVDISVTTDVGGGYIVGWMMPTEWLHYTVTVATTDVYTVHARVASRGAGGTFHLETNGIDRTGPITIPDTGGWQNWVTLAVPATLVAGPQSFRFVIDTIGQASGAGNVNWLEVFRGVVPVPPPPPPPPPPPLPPPPPDLPPVVNGVLRLPAGGDLQAALNIIQPGETILLAPGTYLGNFRLRKKTGDGVITIRTDGLDDTAIPPGVRINGQALSPRMAKLGCLGTQCLEDVLATDDGASNYTLIGIEVLGKESYPDRDLVVFGPLSMTSLDQVPQNIIVDRSYIHGGSRGGHRGIMLNTKNGTVMNSDIRGFLECGRDSQAIAIGNGPGPFHIENNYLEGSGENFMAGGVDPSIPGLVPTGLIFRRNHVFKPLTWKTQTGCVKNLFELKNMRDAIIQFNLFENVWRDAQPGHAIVFTPRNQDGRCPQCIVENVEFSHNVVKNVEAFGMNITGFDDIRTTIAGSGRIKVHGNLFLNTPRGIQATNGIDALHVSHNTWPHITYALLTIGGSARLGLMTRFTMVDNVAGTGAFGIASECSSGGFQVGGGIPSLDCATGSPTGGPANYVVTNNVIELHPDRPIKFPAGNFMLAIGTLAAHLDPAALWRYRPDAGQVSTDGLPLGADVDKLKSVMPPAAFAPVPRWVAPRLATPREVQQFKESVLQ